MASRFDLYNDETNNDLIVENYDLRISKNKTQYVSQKITEKLLFVKGEWPLNKNLGLPYFGEKDEFGRRIRGTGIHIKNPDLNYIKTLFRNEILDIDEVEDIVNLDLTLETSTRTLTVELEVDIGEEETITRRFNI
jgi:hypothetical protein